VNADRPRLCVALDVADADAARRATRSLAEHVDVFKIGLQLFCAEGPSVIEAVRNAGAQEIFLDLKLHDIPNTVAGAVKSARRHAVDYLTLHTGGGRAMLEAALSEAGPIKLLGVTVLTSLTDHDLSEAGHTLGAPALVEQRVALAADVGLAGVVCSPLELTAVAAKLGSGACIVTPGIRLEGDASADQRRVATPERALADGATMLVVGRPILGAVDPVAVARSVRSGLQVSK